MSNSRKDSRKEAKHEVSRLYDNTKSTDKSLDLDITPQTTIEPSEKPTKDSQAPATPSCNTQEDHTSFNVSRNFKYTNTTQKNSTKTTNIQDCRTSCNQEKGRTNTSSKKLSETKTDASKQISEGKCTSQTSDTIKNASNIYSVVIKSKLKPVFKSGLEEKSVDQQTVNNYRDTDTAADTAPLKIQDAIDNGREILSTQSPKKPETPTKTTENKHTQTYRKLKYLPGINFPKESVKKLIEKYENLTDSAKKEQNQRTPVKITDDVKQTPAAKPTVIREKIQPRKRLSLLNESIPSSISPENTASSRISLPNKLFSSISPDKIHRYFEAKMDLPKESISPSISPDKIPRYFEAKINLPKESITPSISPDKIPSYSEANINIWESISPSISPDKIPRYSEAKINLHKESISPSIRPEKAQNSRAISLRNEISPLIVPEKVQSDIRATINFLNVNTTPEKKSDNSAIQSDTERAEKASDLQSTACDGAIPTVCTLYREIGNNSTIEQQNDAECAEEFPHCLPLEKNEVLTYRSLKLQESIVVQRLCSDTEAETLKDFKKGMLPLSKSSTNTSCSTSLSSKGPAENIALCPDQLDIGGETIVSKVQFSMTQRGAKPKVNIGETSKRRNSTQQRKTFECALDILDSISLKGMENLEIILQEIEKRSGKMYPRSDWIVTIEEIEETELGTLRKMARMVEEELKISRTEKEVSGERSCNDIPARSKKFPENALVKGNVVKPLPNLKLEFNSKQDKSSSDQQAEDELDNADVPMQQMSANALFEMLQELKIQHSFDAWMELMRLFYGIGRFHTSSDLKAVRRRMYNEEVIKELYDCYWTPPSPMRNDSTKDGYFKENDFNFRKLRCITFRMGKMTLAMIWLDIIEQLEIGNNPDIFREEKTVVTGVEKCLPSAKNDSSMEIGSESSSGLIQKENSKKPQPFSKYQAHLKLDEDCNKKPKQTDRVHSSKPPAIGSSEDSRLEGNKHQFSQVCRENSLLKELMRQKLTNKPFREEFDIPVKDSTLHSVSAWIPLSGDSSEVIATSKTDSSFSKGSRGDSLTQCTQTKEMDAKANSVSKHAGAVVQDLNEPESQLTEIFDKIFGDIFADFIQKNMNNF